MRAGKHLPGLLLALSLSQGLCFADYALQQDFQNWDVVTLTLPVTPNKKVLWYGEVQPRVGTIQSEGATRTYAQLILRTAAGYRLTKKVSIWQGYAWAPIFSPRNINEHRIFQQLSVNGKLGKVILENRTRFEQRWIENTGGNVSLRLRHRALGLYPLDKEEKWFLSVSDEAFVNFNNVPNGPSAGFEQNRLFVGVRRKLTSYANAELGYLNQYVNSREILPDRMNHAIMLSVNFSPGSQPPAPPPPEPANSPQELAPPINDGTTQIIEESP